MTVPMCIYFQAYIVVFFFHFNHLTLLHRTVTAIKTCSRRKNIRKNLLAIKSYFNYRSIANYRVNVIWLCENEKKNNLAAFTSQPTSSATFSIHKAYTSYKQVI